MQELWDGAWTPELFWNMLLHTKHDKQQHCYMLKYWPNKGIVMVKATKNKRKLDDMTGGPQRMEDKQPGAWGKAGDKGGGRGYATGAVWTGDHRAAPTRTDGD
eukprot:12877585-Heterocapsa_arctica.AAC.1